MRPITRANPMSATVHWRTPELKVSDPRGLPIRQVDYLRKVADGPLETLITRQRHDTLGRQVEQWDPRLSRPNLTSVYRLSGEALRVDSVDAGRRLSLVGLAGEVLRHWDQRAHHWRTTYDNQLRVIAIEENAQPNVETFTYADGSADPGHNRRGQMLEQIDRAGVLSFSGFSLHGQPLSETRTFPDANRYTSHRRYSANGALLTQTDAGAHRQHTRYDIAGQLKQVMLQLDASSPRQDILNDAQYNAAGQIIEQNAGNGVISTWGYDPIDGRLHTLKAGKPGKALCQNLEYVHDRMGNVLRIDDHTLTTVFFANQRVDGHREFAYDSLYRLTCASGFEAEKPNLQPGLPDLITPIDPGRRFNYTEHYQYDQGNNLTQLCHRRDGNNFTRQMRIDDHSNRGVRWEKGDPEPIFDELFDPHGNQQWLQRGQPLSWNTRDQLAKVTLLQHGNGLADDEETYLYSQGVRVYKHHVWHTPSANHFHDVCYLPGLEIRTRSDGQQLHVITLSIGVGSVRCLHWVSEIPDEDIEPDQLRYHLTDHLGSSTLELDRDGALISLEFYYPYGGTCWYAAQSEVEADCKTIRYSGKEMDVSGFNYYGARYYAPWLQRWVSADPGGDVDGLNLYAFVGNNPLGYIDSTGNNKTAASQKDMIFHQLSYLSTINKKMITLDKQLHSLARPRSFRFNILKTTINLTVRAAINFFTAYKVTGHAFEGSNIAGEFQGLTLGNKTADTFSEGYENIMTRRPIVPSLSGLSPESIRSESRDEPGGPLDGLHITPSNWDERTENLKATAKLGINTFFGAVLPAVAEFSELYTMSKEATRAEEGILSSELDAYDSALDKLHTSVMNASQIANSAFEALGVNEFYANSITFLIDLALGEVGGSKSRMLTRSALEFSTERAVVRISNAKAELSTYRTYLARRANERAA
jgi:insecticidal toxin complex protein TccC